MSHKVPHSSTPIVLLIGLFDPTGKQDIPADAVTCAAHGVHSVSAITGVAIADTASTLHIEVCQADQLDEQVRFLLEDTPVQAIKVGHVASVEQISVIAQIAADYADVPMVLHLGPKLVQAGHEEESEPDEVDVIAHATLELLVPQSELVVIGPNAADRWLDDDLAELMDVSSGPQSILQLGAGWVLVSAFRQRPGSLVHLLASSEGVTLTWPWSAGPERTQDNTGLLACAAAAKLAHGDTMEDASKAACEYGLAAIGQAFQAGMGQRIARRLPGVTT